MLKFFSFLATRPKTSYWGLAPRLHWEFRAPDRILLIPSKNVSSPELVPAVFSKVYTYA